MRRCPVCNGATTCPEGQYLEVRPLEAGDVLYLGHGQEIPPGLRVTHRTKRALYALPVQKGPYRLLLVGTAQAGRIRAHYGVRPTWVGMARYAFWVIPAQG